MEGFVEYQFDDMPLDPDPSLFFGCIIVAICVIVLVLISVS